MRVGVRVGEEGREGEVGGDNLSQGVGRLLGDHGVAVQTTQGLEPTKDVRAKPFRL